MPTKSSVPTFVEVFIQTRFPGFHRWKDAPDKYKYLRDYHRHEFHVALCVPVNHDNRDVEFINLKKEVDTYIYYRWKDIHTELSCEQMAKALLDEFKGTRCIVTEDGENGAIAYRPAVVPLEDKEVPQFNLNEKDCMAAMSAGTRSPLLLPSGSWTFSAMDKCFEGLEAEGPEHIRGVRTLFVPGNINTVELRKAVGAIQIAGWWNSARIYLGAGNKPCPNPEVIKYVLRSIPPNRVVIETDSVERVTEPLEDIRLWALRCNKGEYLRGLIVLTHELDDRETLQNRLDISPSYEIQVYRKQVTDTQAVWHGNPSDAPLVTQLNDPLYLQDKELAY